MRRPEMATVPLAVLSEAVGMEAEALVIVLGMFTGLRGLRLVNRPGVVLAAVVPFWVPARLGLVKIAGRWAIDEGADADARPSRPPGVALRLGSTEVTFPDRRQPTPLEVLAQREEIEEQEPQTDDSRPPDRIGNLSKWLDEWSRTGVRPAPPLPKARPRRPAPASRLAPPARPIPPRNSFDLKALRRRLEASKAAAAVPAPSAIPTPFATLAQPAAT